MAPSDAAGIQMALGRKHVPHPDLEGVRLSFYTGLVLPSHEADPGLLKTQDE